MRNLLCVIVGVIFLMGCESTQKQASHQSSAPTIELQKTNNHVEANGPKRAWTGQLGPTGKLSLKGKKDAWDVQVGLTKWGREGALSYKPSATNSKVTGTRASYKHAQGLTEWYDNKSNGLEHGFTLASKPAGKGQLSFELGFEGGKLAKVSEKSLTVTPTKTNKTLKYDALKVWDAHGTLLASKMVRHSDHHARILVNDDHAVYPITVDPTWKDGVLLEINPTQVVKLGSSIDIDGSTSMVGVQDYSGRFTSSGAVYITRLKKSAWTFVQILQPPFAQQSPGGRFGRAVAISGDHAFVAAVNTTGQNHGVIFVYRKTRTHGWYYTQTIKPTQSEAGDEFGTDIAIDGTNAVVGAPGSDRAFVFEFDEPNDRWEEVSVLQHPDVVTGDAFGRSVSIQGTRAAVGAHLHNDQKGAVFTYLRDNLSGSWLDDGKVVLDAEISKVKDHFGWDVVVYGNTLLVGAPDADFTDNNNQVFQDAGSAHFYRKLRTWSLDANIRLIPNQANQRFGASLDLNENLGIVLSASPVNSQFLHFLVKPIKIEIKSSVPIFDDGSDTNIYCALSGELLLLTDPNFDDGKGRILPMKFADNWSQSVPIQANFRSGSKTGPSVASTDRWIAIQAQDFNFNRTSQGGVFLFEEITDQTWQYRQTLTPQLLETIASSDIDPNFGSSLVMNGNLLAVSSVSAQDPSTNRVYIYELKDNSWVYLTHFENAVSTENFGASVALSDDHIVIGAPSPTGGQVYIYEYTDQLGTSSPEPIVLMSDKVRFGQSVSILGETLIIGAQVLAAQQTGMVVSYKFDGNDWIHEKDHNIPNWDGKSMHTLALTPRHFIISVSAVDSRPGFAHVFEADTMNVGWTLKQTLESPAPKGSELFGSSMAALDDQIVVGVGGHSALGMITGGAHIFGFNRKTNMWEYLKFLDPIPTSAATSFGMGLAITKNQIVMTRARAELDGAIVYTIIPDPVETMLSITAPVDKMIIKTDSVEIKGEAQVALPVKLLVERQGDTMPVFDQSVTVMADETFTIKLESLFNGMYTVTATQGNNTVKSTFEVKVLDLDDPIIIGDVNENDEVVLNEGKPTTIKGKAPPGANVEIYVDGELVGSTTANDKGEWSFSIPAQQTNGLVDITIIIDDGVRKARIRLRVRGNRFSPAEFARDGCQSVPVHLPGVPLGVGLLLLGGVCFRRRR